MFRHDVGERRQRGGEQLRGDRLRKPEHRGPRVWRIDRFEERNTSRPKFCSLRHSSSAEKATSADVKSRPSCHFTPPRKAKLWVFPSGLGVQAVDSTGTRVLPSAPRSNSGSITLRATRKTPLLAAIAGFQLRYRSRRRRAAHRRAVAPGPALRRRQRQCGRRRQQRTTRQHHDGPPNAQARVSPPAAGQVKAADVAGGEAKAECARPTALVPIGFAVVRPAQ